MRIGEYSEVTHRSATLLITDPTWPVLRSNPGRSDEKPATNRLAMARPDVLYEVRSDHKHICKFCIKYCLQVNNYKYCGGEELNEDKIYVPKILFS
jgi:hypothetical protein